MKIIGLAGRKRSGKDTVFDMLSERPGCDVRRLAFADVVKQEVAVACGVGLSFIEAHKDTFRPILQWWGTEFKRELVRRDYWLEKVSCKLDELQRSEGSDNLTVVITDCRFPDEVELVRARKGFMALVKRHADGERNPDGHESETDLDESCFDAVIPNRGNLEELRKNVGIFADVVM